MAIENELLDKLLAEYKKPEDIIGENGLLKQLTKALLERAMSAELSEHLGFAGQRDRALRPVAPNSRPLSRRSGCVPAEPYPPLKQPRRLSAHHRRATGPVHYSTFARTGLSTFVRTTTSKLVRALWTLCSFIRAKSFVQR